MRILLKGGKHDGLTSWLPGIPASVQFPAPPGDVFLCYRRARVDLEARSVVYSLSDERRVVA